MKPIQDTRGYSDSLVNPRVRRHVYGLEYPPRGYLCSDVVIQRAARRPVRTSTPPNNNDLLTIDANNASIKLCDVLEFCNG